MCGQSVFLHGGAEAVPDRRRDGKRAEKDSNVFAQLDTGTTELHSNNFKVDGSVHHRG